MTREEVTIQMLRDHIEALEETIENQNKVIKTLEQQSSKDCIARQPLIDNWNCCADMLMGEGDSEVVMGWIFDAPSVIPQPEMSEWVSKGDVYPAWKYCKKCGEPWTFNCGTPNFCPVCGRKIKRK